jgi:acetamidase/formamidase
MQNNWTCVGAILVEDRCCCSFLEIDRKDAIALIEINNRMLRVPNYGTLGLNRVEAMALGSSVVDLRITQIVNGVKGVHACLPHGALR